MRHDGVRESPHRHVLWRLRRPNRAWNRLHLPCRLRGELILAARLHWLRREWLTCCLALVGARERNWCSSLLGNHGLGSWHDGSLGGRLILSGRLCGHWGRCRLRRILLGWGPCRLRVSDSIPCRRGGLRSEWHLVSSFVAAQGIITLDLGLGGPRGELRNVHWVGTKWMVPRRKGIL